MRLKLLFIIFLFSVFGWGQVNITPTRTDVSGFSGWTDSSIAGTTYLQILTASSSTISPAMNFNSYTGETLNFKARTFNGSTAAEIILTVWISTDNGVNWTNLGTRTPLSNTLVAQSSFDLSSYSGTQVKIMFTVAGTSDTIGVGVDDISISGISTTTPSITVTPSSRTGFTYVAGSGPSGEQSFTVSGSNLTANLVITPSTNYEISSTFGSGFGSLVTLTPTTGTLANTAIYVRLKAGLAVANYNSENITATSTGATTQNVSCSGTVTAASSGCNELYISEYGEGSSNNKYIEIYNPTASTITLTGNYDISVYINGGTTPTTIALTGTIAAYSTFVLNNAATITANQTSGSLTFNGDDALALRKASALIDVIGVIGADPGTKWGTTPTTLDNTLVRKSTIQNGDSNGSDAFDPVTEWNGYALDTWTYVGAHESICDPNPIITVSPTTLIGFTYVYGLGPAAEQNFTVSGSKLTANLIVTPPANYEISLTSGSGFVSSPSTLSFTPSSGTVTSKTIYVRLKAGLSVASYNSAAINITSTGATTKTVTCSGNVTAANLTVTGYSGTNKTYDRLLTATLSGTGSLVGVVGGDVVTLSGTATGAFATKTVGVGKTITVTGLSLTGAAAGNYTLSQPSGLTANITTKALTVTGATATTKVYDRTNTAAITGSTLVGVVGGDAVTITGTGTFASVNVGTGIAVTSTQALGGADAANYTVTLPTGLSANITAKALTIAGVTASNKVYDGNTTATLSGTAALIGLITADSANVTLNTGSATATFANATIGTGKAVTVTGYTISGTASGNYTLSQPSGLTANITASIESDLVVTGTHPATISSLVNNAAPLTSSTGVEVLQFKVRDGGIDLYDADLLPTILTDFTIVQVANTVTTWTDAIETVALFDGLTLIKTGTVTASQIQFTGLAVSVDDNKEKTLSIRLSLKNPLGADAFDGEHFGFSISNANTTFASTGSGEAAFTAVANSTNTNVISVVGTKLVFTTQPSATGLNGPMTTVKVTATDANGNVDIGFTAPVSITSTGTMISSPQIAIANNGIASFSSIIHTVAGTFTFIATSSGLTSVTSNNFIINNSTAFKPGELLFVGYDAQINGSQAFDEYLIGTLVDITTGTSFTIVNSRYEAGAAANIRTDKWGGGGDIASERPYTALITYKGTTPIPAGSILAFTTDDSVNWFGKVEVVTGTTKTIRTSDFSGSTTVNFDPNISTSNPDQIYLVQGSFIFDGTNTLNEANYVLTGTLLHGFSNRAAFVPLTSACSGGSNNEDRVSRIPIGLNCLSFDNAGNFDSAFYKNDQVHGTAVIPVSKSTIMQNVSNSSNWTYAFDLRYTKDPSSSLATRAERTFYVGSDNAYTIWTGKKDTNWFNCGNWDTLKVPDETVDVQINDIANNREAKVDNTADFANYYSGTAKVKNLAISGEKVTLETSEDNKLDVRGDLTISGTGVLDMSDDNISTNDGQLYLYGNWTNSRDKSFFLEGNGTVHFLGSTAQIINNNVHTNPEEFPNVVLGNHFNTLVSNNLIANGDLTVNVGKTVTVSPSDYLKVQNGLKNNGTVNILSNDFSQSGSLVQINDTDTNEGDITFNRTVPVIRSTDYTYWSSPVWGQDLKGFSIKTSTDMFYSFDATIFPENWKQETSSFSMGIGIGYCIYGEQISGFPPAFFNASFKGKPNNGKIDVPIIWNNDPLGTSNLIGNPYPSALDADKFLDFNKNVIEGTIYFWTHNTDLQLRADIIASGATPGTGVLAYTSDDYASYNGVGGVATNKAPSGVSGMNNNNIPNGKIAAGQAFFTTSLTANTNSIATFKNSMRLDKNSEVIDNSQFFKTRNPKSKTETFEKHRIWLNLTNTQGAFKQTLVGYITDATNEYDSRFDGETFDGNEFVDFYSLNQEKNLVIQGRALPFDENDEVPLGFRTTINGDFTIKIDQTDGVLTNQAVFIEDKLTNTIFDLRSGPFTFNTVAGTFNDRFVLRYTDKTLGTIDVEMGDNQVLVSNKNKQIKVNSKVEPIDKVMVYDLLGRLLFKKDKVNSTEFSILNLISNSETILVKVSLQNGETVTRKILY